MEKLKLRSKFSNTFLRASVFLFLLSPVSASASNHTELSRGARAAEPTGADGNLMGIFTTIADILLFVLGAVAVIMLIVGGFRYVVSGGDSSAIEGAKNTILYAIAGIVVAFLAFAAVRFVIGALEDGTEVDEEEEAYMLPENPLASGQEEFDIL